MIIQPEIDNATQVGTRRAETHPSCTRRLLLREDVIFRLQLSEDQVQQLINTRQLTTIRIASQERFDSLDLERLIDSYKTTASRRSQ